MIDALFLFNDKGDIIVSRIFKEAILKIDAVVFRVKVIHSRRGALRPIVNINGTSFCYLRENNVWLVSATRRNINTMLAFEFMKKFIEVLKSYFRKVTEDSIRDNFLLVYQLMDEMLDNGSPQITEVAVLKSVVSDTDVSFPTQEEQTQITAQLTGQVPWRPYGLRYIRNQVNIEIIEYIDLLMTSLGTVLSVLVSGSMLVNAKLSGMPRCKLAINDGIIFLPPKKNLGKQFCLRGRENHGIMNSKHRVAVDDCQFHQCVDLATLESERAIKFTPPDEEFELMRYRVTTDVGIPFRVTPLLRTIDANLTEIRVILRANFPPGMSARGVEVTIPTPSHVCGIPRLLVKKGNAKYDPESNTISWKIKRILGMSDTQIDADVQTLKDIGHVKKNRKVWKPTISMQFEIPFTPSGLNVCYFDAFDGKVGYFHVDKTVKYMGRTGCYETRC